MEEEFNRLKTFTSSGVSITLPSTPECALSENLTPSLKGLLDGLTLAVLQLNLSSLQEDMKFISVLTQTGRQPPVENVMVFKTCSSHTCHSHDQHVHHQKAGYRARHSGITKKGLNPMIWISVWRPGKTSMLCTIPAAETNNSWVFFLSCLSFLICQ